ncbi:Rare lipoprotein A precursor [Leminorella richardii]|uniref:Endolytic peptidoglycan transglycosylase RlpA n=1 Tax=Leminorella richardii TaxID=158841 RepID=A0A2X4XYK3_9GAMM|nr:endolytic peptidoglycan transglycosylase RlpA [Leminorella richardii]SQI41664.1 Rare lipoprotein A precursor [Leminorella richardii]
MRKSWLWIGTMSLFLAACQTTPPTSTLPPLPQNGPAKEIGGAEPRYEPYNQGTMKDYKVNGNTYRIVTNPENFSQVGLATWYGKELHGNKTALGEVFDANELTAAHPTLPLPSYVRVTNLSNGRQIVVRVNDRGPFTKGRIIDLSKAAADRLNVTSQTKVRLDVIIVSPDGSLSGPGTIGSTVVKQSYALPSRPDFGNANGLSAQQSESVNLPAQPDNSLSIPTPPPADAPTTRLNAPTQGENVTLPTAPDSQLSIPASPDAVAVVPAPVNADNARQVSDSTSAQGFVVQVMATNDRARAQALQQNLSSQLSVPGRITESGAFYRVQMGPFTTKAQAQSLLQRLSDSGHANSFITTASAR